MNENQIERRRCLVTGATGYIGANLVQRLVADKWDVHLIVRKHSDRAKLISILDQVTIHEHDGSTEGMIDLVKRAKPDSVFHLASLFLAQHKSADVQELILSNILFGSQLLEAMASNGVRHLVNTGTSWQHHQNEDYNPTNLYAATKQGFESILKYYVEARNMVVSTLSLFDTYGPNDTRPKLISMLWKAAMMQQVLEMSPGDQMIDIVYIDDVIEAFILAENDLQTRQYGHECYGVSSGNPMKLRELVEIFKQSTGSTLVVNWGGRPYREREVMEPWTNYRPVIGWAPKTEFRAGILKTRPVQTRVN